HRNLRNIGSSEALSHAASPARVADEISDKGGNAVMSNQSMIHLELEFSGALLPVETNEQGHKIVPLKPIAEVVGLHWQTQLEKVQEGYLKRRLGTCIRSLPYAGQQREMVCIRLDRVAAYLNTVNPEMVRGRG